MVMTETEREKDALAFIFFATGGLLTAGWITFLFWLAISAFSLI
jgi:hypothetical protein